MVHVISKDGVVIAMPFEQAALTSTWYANLGMWLSEFEARVLLQLETAFVVKH